MTYAQNESNRYHHDYYSTHGLFESGTWLEKPNGTLIDLAKSLVEQSGLRILDLGAGVGRNAIPIAKILGKSITSINCVDIVPLALEKLEQYALKHGVSQTIIPVLSGVAEYYIEPNEYNLIAAMSVLEHAVQRENFSSLIKKIQLGTKVNGFNCLSIATDLIETDSATKKRLEPLIEAALSASDCAEVLRDLYHDWEIQKLDFSPFTQSLLRKSEIIEWSAKYCLFVAKRLV